MLIYYLVLIIFVNRTYSFELARSSSPDEDLQFTTYYDYRSASPSPEPVSDFPETKKDSLLGEPFKTFWDWKNACMVAIATNSCPVSQEQFLKEIKNFIIAFDKASIYDQNNWVQSSDAHSAIPSIKFYIDKAFEPYAMKLEVSDEEKTAFLGDIHGDITSFNAFLEHLSSQGITDPQDPFLVKPKANVILLGDYTDRGNHGVEVLFALARFLRINFTSKPSEQRVFALRGNHEDILINWGMNPGTTSLAMELRKKFNDLNSFTTIDKFYNCLPLALILKTKTHAMLCNHGGIEPGFKDIQTLAQSPKRINYVLIHKLYRKELLEKLYSTEHRTVLQKLYEHNAIRNFDPRSDSSNSLYHYQFLWGDYEFNASVDPQAPIEFYEGRGMRFPQHYTQAWFTANSSKECTLVGEIRGHQHSHDTMNRILNKDGKSSPEEAGLAKIWLPSDQQQPPEKVWQGIVCTLCACPNTGYGKSYNYNFGAYAILTTADQLDDWKLKVHRFGQTL